MEQYEKSPKIGDLELEKDVGGAIATQVNTIKTSLDLQAKKITIGIDTVAYNVKPTEQETIAGIKSRVHKNTQTMTLANLVIEHAFNGKAISPFVGNGTADGTKQTEMLVLDFDNKKAEPEKDENGKSIFLPLPYNEQIMPADVIKRSDYCGLHIAFIAYSPSHIKDEWERFRAYFVFSNPITEKENMTKAREALGIIFPEADANAGKLGQFFFGSIGGVYVE